MGNNDEIMPPFISMIMIAVFTIVLVTVFWKFEGPHSKSPAYNQETYNVEVDGQWHKVKVRHKTDDQ